MVAAAVLLAVALVLASCGGGGGATPTPSPPAATAASPGPLPTGDFPGGLQDFARTLDKTFAQGALDLTKFTLFSDWSCPNNYFPAAGPACEQAAEGAAVKAIDIGAYASEGDIYDGPSYGRFLADWIYDALRDSTDTYGTGAPRVWALADMPDQFEGTQGQLGTFEIIATRLAESPSGHTPQREVLAFYVAGTVQGWLITQLQRSPLDFLDPTAPESVTALAAWQRWTEAAPTGPLVSRWPSQLEQRRVAYIDPANALHVAEADGGDQVIAQATCPKRGSKETPTWSPDTRRIAVTCGNRANAADRPSIEVYAADGHGQPVVIDNVERYYWSPNSRRLAYQTADFNIEPYRAVVRIYDFDAGQDTLLNDNAVLLAWPRSDELLLGLDPQPATIMGDVVRFASFQANWYNLSAGATGRAPRFDNGQQFWIVSPDKAVVLTGQSDRKEGGATLGVYDLSTGNEVTLAGLAIRYPSEGIPRGNVQVSPFGNRFVWADGLSPAVISEAALDGSLATRLDEVAGFVQGLTWDGLVLYMTADSVLTLRDTHTGAETTWRDAVLGAISPVPAPVS